MVAHKIAQGKNGTLYAPIFEFKNRSQELRNFTSSLNSKPARYEMDEKVKIIYDSRNPYQLMVLSFWVLYRWCVILLRMARPLLIIGGACLLFINR